MYDGMIDGFHLVRLGTNIQRKLITACNKKLRLNNATVKQWHNNRIFTTYAFTFENDLWIISSCIFGKIFWINLFRGLLSLCFSISWLTETWEKTIAEKIMEVNCKNSKESLQYVQLLRKSEGQQNSYIVKKTLFDQYPYAANFRKCVKFLLPQ